MKTKNRKLKIVTIALGAVCITAVINFKPQLKEKYTQLKQIYRFENFKRKYSTLKEIELAKNLPDTATMTEIYNLIKPAFNPSVFNHIGNMQEAMFNLFLEEEIFYTDEGIEASNLLAKGLSAQAIAVLNKKGRDDLTWDERALLGVSYLRMGEQQNCIQDHNQDSCLFPIKNLGIHRLSKGADEAMIIFNDLIKLDPARMDWRWLLNISAMAAGKFPEGVPEELRVNASILKSEIEFPRFVDVAKDVGIHDASIGAGVIMDDFNNDGHLDIVNISSLDEGYTCKLFINDGKGKFVDQTKKSGFLGIPTGLNMVQVDYDNDGFLDIFIFRGGWMGSLGELPSSLLKNNGDSSFVEVTKEAGLMDFSTTQTGAWADFDNDGDLDLFLGREYNFLKEVRSKFYENLGNGKFKEVSEEAGLNIFEHVKGTVALDYNNDGLMDIAITNMKKQKVHLFRNLGKSNPGNKFQFKQDNDLDVVLPFSIASFDYDNDGWEDIIVPAYDVRFARTGNNFFAKDEDRVVGMLKFFKNNHGVFKEVSKDLGLNISAMVMGLNYGDINNDGYIDLYLGTGGPSFTRIVPNKMFLNMEGKKFQDVTVAGGFGVLQKGHGIAFGDYNGDGHVDVYSSLGGVFASDFYQDALYHNPGNTNRWIKLKLHGIRSNRFGIGAQIKITTSKGDFYRRVNTGGSFGANPLTQHIGLGDSLKIKNIEISWPGQKTKQVFKNVETNSSFEIQEGSKHLKKL